MVNFLLLGYLSGVVVPACFCFTLPFRFSKSFSLRFVMISVIILDSSTYYPRIYRNHRCHYTVPMLPHFRHEMMHIELHSLGCETSLDTCCDDFLNRVLRLLFAWWENSYADILINEKKIKPRTVQKRSQRVRVVVEFYHWCWWNSYPHHIILQLYEYDGFLSSLGSLLILGIQIVQLFTTSLPTRLLHKSELHWTYIVARHHCTGSIHHLFHHSFCWKATLENAPGAPFQKSRFYPNIILSTCYFYTMSNGTAVATRWIKVMFPPSS